MAPTAPHTWPLLLAQIDAGMERTFSPGTTTHYITLVFSAVIIAGLAILGVRFRATPAAEKLRLSWLAFVAIVQIVSITFYALWRGFDWGHSLPLEVCDLAGLVAFAALAFRWRIARVTLYYWAFALTTQAFVTPILLVG